MAPAVWKGPEQKRPKGQVTLAGISSYIDWIYGKVMNLSGYTVEAAQAAGFRGENEAGAASGGDSTDGGHTAKPSPETTGGRVRT